MAAEIDCDRLFFGKQKTRAFVVFRPTHKLFPSTMEVEKSFSVVERRKVFNVFHRVGSWAVE